MDKLFIKVPIVCTIARNEDNVDYEALGLQAKIDKHTETRFGGIKIKNIDSWYPSMDESTTIAEVNHDIYILDISIAEFEELIQDYIINPVEDKDII